MYLLKVSKMGVHNSSDNLQKLKSLLDLNVIKSTNLDGEICYVIKT